MLITVRQYDPGTDSGVIEYVAGNTIIKTGDSRLTSDPDIESFLPDGLWLAFDEDSAIGAILLATEERHDGDAVLVRAISVDRNYRRQGLGGLLMHKADLYADSKKIRLLTGIIPESNEAALSLFKKCRFTVSETGEGQVLMKKMRIPHGRRP